jgi:DNA-binding NtrC family response regulator
MQSGKSGITVLSISPFEQDHQFLRSIVSRSNWRLVCAFDCREAWILLHKHPVTAIITERFFPDSFTWQELVDEASAMQDAPAVIVAARDASDELWAEIVRCGGFDLLAKPFDPDAVRRSIIMAWRQAVDTRFLRARAAVGRRHAAAGI